MITREITYSKIDEIYRFIREAIYNFKSLNVPDKDIKILIPDTMKQVFEYYYRLHIDFENQHTFQQEITNQFCGIEVYPHYKNEIVVYCTKFDLKEEFDKPVIICLKDILDKK